MHQPSTRRSGFSGRVVFCVICLTVLFTAALVQAETIEISSFYGNYDTTTKQPGQHALSLRGPKMETWQTPVAAEQPYHIGVAIPHLKDAYWLAVNHGIVDEARRSGVRVTLVEAGGYTNLTTQQEQLRKLADAGVDGIILGSISYTENNAVVAQLAKRGIPVLEVINDIEAPAIAAKALVSFYDMGFFAGEYVAHEAEDKGIETLDVHFFPGPKGSGWADDTLEGFKAATEFFLGEIHIHDVAWGDTGAEAQSELIRASLAANPDADYIVGNAVAADVATGIVTETGAKAQIVATYITPPVFEHIRAGRVAAAPADMTVDQARIALSMLVRILNGETPGQEFPFRAGPLIPVVSAQNVDEFAYDTLFGPRGFTPVFNVAP